MSDSKYSLSLGGWMFCQCALLVVHYGFKKILPFWVLWLPSFILLGVITLVIIILIIGIIIAIVTN